MTRDSLLRWLERGLLGVGLALAAWCAAVLVEARFYKQLPVPASYGPLKVTQTVILPGEGGGKTCQKVRRQEGIRKARYERRIASARGFRGI